MTLNRNIIFLMILLIGVLLFNGLNPLIQPPDVDAKEVTAISGDNNDSDCSLAMKNSIKSLDEVNNVKRLLGYIESSVNDIQLTVKGIDRKMNALPSFKSTKNS